MQARADDARPDMQYRCMDARRLSLEAGTADVILDKGCLDCVLCDADPKVKVGQMLSHMSRVRATPLRSRQANAQQSPRKAHQTGSGRWFSSHCLTAAAALVVRPLHTTLLMAFKLLDTKSFSLGAGRGSHTTTALFRPRRGSARDGRMVDGTQGGNTVGGSAQIGWTVLQHRPSERDFRVGLLDSPAHIVRV